MSDKKPSLAHRLYTGDISYDFIGTRRRWYTVSAVIVLICILAIAVRGLNLSIDFTGGSEFSVPTQVTAQTVSEYQEATEASGVPDLGEVQVLTIGENQVRIQVRALNASEINQMTAHLAGHAGVPTAEVTNNLVGPLWGQQITQQGVIALLVFLALVSLMIWAYFRNWKMSVAAMVALMHDLVLTVGVYAIVQFAFTPATLIGVLTILGYSLYDTVVVFDKVRDNTAHLDRTGESFVKQTNLAINQVLVRSINTTIIGVLPVAALLAAGVFLLGTGPLKDLGLAMFVGMIAGAYSSIFLAAPLFSQLKEREPAILEHEAKVARKAARRSKGASTDADVPTATPAGATAARVSAAGTEPIDPARLGAVRADALGQRQQPRNSTRSERRQDGR